eukprot:scaffold70454_cov57-Attheya_sp.AAC.2
MLAYYSSPPLLLSSCVISVQPQKTNHFLSGRGKSYNPVGDTDSEAVFCAILNALKARFDKLPSLPVLHDTISALCQEIVNHDSDETILNFLIGCGQHLQFVYSWPGSRPGSTVWNGLHYIIREPPFQQAHLADCDYTVNFADSNGDDSRVAVIATKPLTDDEEWIEMERGELILFDQGLPHISPVDCVSILTSFPDKTRFYWKKI